jgi:GNAT superfamily N-acetyltransferase
MPDLDFRFAAYGEVPAVAALIERAYRGPEAAAGWTTETHLLTGPRSSVAEVERLFGEPDSGFVLAFDDGELVGCALLQRRGGAAYFGMFSVQPSRQTEGVGRGLLAACEAMARDMWSANAMSMSVISLRDDLIEWYERRGYVRTGAGEPFPFHEHPDARRTDFELTELRKQPL